MKNYKLAIQFQNACSFLEWHPGVSPYQNFFSTNAYIYTLNVCKNGISKLNHWTNDMIEVDGKPYKEVYGYDWEYYQTLYYCDYGYFKYSPDDKYIKYLTDIRGIDPKNIDIFLAEHHGSYERYECDTVQSDSYENLIIKTANDVKEKFGNFEYGAFVSENESVLHIDNLTIHLRWLNWFKKNHKKFK